MTKLIPSTTPLRTFKGHEERIRAVAVFPDRRRMVTCSYDKTLCLWDLKTGLVLKKMEGHRSWVLALAVSRDGQIIASGDLSGVVIAWNGETGESLTQPIKAHDARATSLDFSADGTVLATGSFYEATVKLWCTKTWQQQGNQIKFDSKFFKLSPQVRYSPSGELLAIATNRNIAIYNSGTRECVATLDGYTNSLAWTPDGTRLLFAAHYDIAEWDTSTWEKVGHPWKGHTKSITAIAVNSAGTLVASTSEDNHVRLWRLSDRRNIAIFEHSSIPTCVTFSVDGNNILSGGEDNQISEWKVRRGFHSNIFIAATAARDSSITGDLSTAEQILTQEIDADANNYTSYVNRSFVMARKQDWDRALEDAIKSISIQPSLIGYISKGIALCGKGNVPGGRVAFDVASMFTNQDSEIIHLLLLIKAIALFNANQHGEAMLLIKELTAACPNADTRACCVVEAYLLVQLGTKALDGARYDEAADHFAAAVNSSAFPSKIIHELYEDLIVLFGWDLESFWLTAHQKRCQAFLSAGKVQEALQSHQHIMDAIHETEKASCLDWSNDFKEQCVLAARDDRILGAEIPGQDQYGYDVEPDFFRGMHGNSQISRPQPQQRPGRFKKFRLAMTRNLHPVAPPAPTPIPAPPAALPPAAAPTTFTAHVRHLFTWQPDHTAPPVVEVPFAQGRKRNAAAGAPADDDSDIIRAEYVDDDPDPQDPNTQQPNTQQPNTQPNTQQPSTQQHNAQQQRQPVAIQSDTGEHGGGKSCFCC